VDVATQIENTEQELTRFIEKRDARGKRIACQITTEQGRKRTKSFTLLIEEN